MNTTRSKETEPFLIPIKDAARLLGIGRTKLYELMGEGKIKTRKIDTRNLIVYASLKEFVDGPLK